MSGAGPIGGYVHPAGDIELNAGRPVTRLAVVNHGDRPIQVGSHFHFAEVNRALRFDRLAAYGQRLDIPAGTAVRFEPGATHDVELVPFAGARIVGLGKAGNPDIMDGVTPGLVIGPGTEVLSGEGLIATPGGVDSHVHMISPQQVWAALSNGVTTLLGGGTGPVEGTNATTTTPGSWNIARMLQAAEGLPVNWGVYGKGNASSPDPLREQILAGACGLKDHEDWGTTPAVIDT